MSLYVTTSRVNMQIECLKGNKGTYPQGTRQQTTVSDNKYCMGELSRLAYEIG